MNFGAKISWKLLSPTKILVDHYFCIITPPAWLHTPALRNIFKPFTRCVGGGGSRWPHIFYIFVHMHTLLAASLMHLSNFCASMQSSTSSKRSKIKKCFHN